MAKFKRKTAEEKKEEIQKLTDGFLEKLDTYFTSEESLKEHLRFMSSFHNYSVRNMILIDEQFQGARAVGSYNFWKEKGANVQKGEKGIKILVPTPVEYFNRNGEWVQKRYANAKEKQGIKNGSIETEKKLFFKVGHVFEYTQTNAREKGIEVSDIFNKYHRDGSIENDKAMYNSLEKVADHLNVTILEQPKEELGTAKGASYPYLKEIALNPRNTDYENVTVLIHELAHAKLHTPETRDNYTTAEKEFQAEMVSYVVASHYDIDTEEFSLSYLHNWTNDKNLEDKEQLLREVKDTSKEFIEIIDNNLELELEKNNIINFSNNKSEIDNELNNITEKFNLSNKSESDKIDFLSTNYPDIHSKYLSYSTVIENKDFITNQSSPLMKIHNNDTELKEFGVANDLDFDNNIDVKYTTLIPSEEGYKVYSSEFNTENFSDPLHHMKNNNVLNEDEYNLLENSFHDHLERKDNEYLKSIMPSIRRELDKEESKHKDDFEIQM